MMPDHPRHILHGTRHPRLAHMTPGPAINCRLLALFCLYRAFQLVGARVYAIQLFPTVTQTE